MCPQYHPEGWELTEVIWTGTDVRNQNTTKIMITLKFGPSPVFRYQLLQPDTPDESPDRPKRKRTFSSPPLTEYIRRSKRQKKCHANVQTDCTSEHFQNIPGERKN